MSGLPLLEVRDLQRGYGGAWRLEIPSLEIERGQLFAILGPTGAGKTTLLRLLHGLDEPSAGRVIFEGRPLTCPPPIDVRRAMAMVFQRPLMLAGSVRDNLAIGPRFRGVWRDGSLAELLRRLDLEALARTPASDLSGGEMQRVALGRALACRPRLLLLDEPAAHLDPGHTAVIEGIIRAAHRQDGITIVLATHNLGQARRLAQRVGLLAAGRLVEVAATETFFERPRHPLTAAYLRGDLLTEGPKAP